MLQGRGPSSSNCFPRWTSFCEELWAEAIITLYLLRNICLQRGLEILKVWGNHMVQALSVFVTTHVSANLHMQTSKHMLPRTPVTAPSSSFSACVSWCKQAHGSCEWLCLILCPHTWAYVCVCVCVCFIVPIKMIEKVLTFPAVPPRG